VSEPTTAVRPRSADPTLVAAPTDQLPERAWVTVGGSGFEPSSEVWVVECPAATADLNECDEIVWTSDEQRFWTDPSGSISPHGRVIHRVLESGYDCAVSPGCTLAAFTLPAGDGPDVVAPLTFVGPPGPERPITQTANPTTHLHDGQLVNVEAVNLPAGYRFEIAQCGTGSDGSSVCSRSTQVADDTGRVVAQLLVHVEIEERGIRVDCRSDSCYVSVLGPLDQIRLTFDA
jgi:hypothetical protein